MMHYGDSLLSRTASETLFGKARRYGWAGGWIDIGLVRKWVADNEGCAHITLCERNCGTEGRGR